MKQAKLLPLIDLSGLNQPVAALKIDSRWQLIIEPVVAFKDALDRIQAGARLTVDDRDLIQRYGLTVDDVVSTLRRLRCCP